MQRALTPSACLHAPLRSARSGEAFSRSAVLSELLGLSQLFVHHEKVDPGHRISEVHGHSLSEELVVVLRGEVVALCAGQRHRVVAGQLFGFPSGAAYAHTVCNESEAPAELLVIATQVPGDRVLYAGLSSP